MKAKIHLLLFALMLFGLGVKAQQVTNIYSFTNGTDGSEPGSGVILSGNMLYGTALEGGAKGGGTVFAVNTNGMGFTNLYAFPTESTNGWQAAALLLWGNTLYGTTLIGGANQDGTIFALNTNGTGFTNLHTFGSSGGYPNSDGAFPSSLIGAGKTLFGTASEGGANGNGTVFAVNTDGTGFTLLHTFSAGAGANSTNGDGRNPFANLVVAGNTLFGTASEGGANGNGTVFAVNTDGTGFTVLHTFGAEAGANDTNCDGGKPLFGFSGGLVLSGNTLYGTASEGGANGNGTVFAVNTDGSEFTVLHTFGATSSDSATNCDGANPNGGLMLSGNTLYGTTRFGGSTGNGTIFAVNINGTGFTVLQSFNTLITDPVGSLILSGTTLIGVNAYGGTDGYGSVFGFSPPPPAVSIASFGNQAVILYPSTGINYTLQTTTNLNSGPWVTVTNPVPITGAAVSNTSPAAFFRLQ